MEEANPGQALAERIYAGQSDSLPMAERLRRVEAGLMAQGYEMKGIKL